MKNFTLFISVVALLVGTVPASAKLNHYPESPRKVAPETWEYDAGPILDDKSGMGRELLELNAAIPYFPGISYDVMGSQKFRPAFGPVSWRMLQQKNSVKILFIGQDATHIAEAAGRPATAGFGGRAQDLANHFGVDYSAAFINTYAFTIRGQYGARGVPYLKNGKINFTSAYLDNELWLMSQDNRSPIVQWRNAKIDWIIRNNPDSLKLIVTFGGSARDTISSFVESKENGEVGTYLKWEDMKRVRMPEFKLQYAGGNNNFPTPLNRQGKDLYREMLGRKLKYTDTKDQREAQKAIRANFNDVKDDMVFSNGGVDGSGLIHPAQLGGYNIGKIRVNGKETRGSLKGLKLSDGSKVKNDLLVVDLPHPTFLSITQMERGRKAVNTLVANKTKGLSQWKANGWKIEPDFEEGRKKRKANFFTRNSEYQYGRGEIGQEYYDFGTPGNRMVSKSSAKRIDASTILLGVRDDKYLSKRNKAGMAEINEMKDVEPAEYPNKGEMFISISRLKGTVDRYDPGPGEEMARLMKDSLYGSNKSNLKDIFKSKTKSPVSIASVGDFGHYRGRLDYAKALIVADPHGWDDIITARALTGLRGQYLQGLMENMTEGNADYGLNHAVLKTVPFGMEGAKPVQWENVLGLTQDYRDAVIEYVLDGGKTEVILVDGEHAQAEVERYMKSAPKSHKSIPVVVIPRDEDPAKFDDNMLAAAKGLQKVGMEYDIADMDYKGQRMNIPSEHLSYYARVWEGTSGDRVITSKDKPGLAFAEVVPNWVVKQKPSVSRSTRSGVGELVAILAENCLPEPGEKPQEFLARKKAGKMPKKCL